MPANADKTAKTTYRRASTPGFLERTGVRYYRYLAQQAGTDALDNIDIDRLPPDEILQSLANIITGFAAALAFAVGALTTFATVWIEWTFKASLPPDRFYLLYSTVLTVMLAAEMTALFWLGLKTVYSLACLTGQHRSEPGSCLPGDDAVPNILARAALEVPDPVIRYLDIDPLKHLSKSKLLLVAVLYKSKVVLSSLAVKFLLIRLFGKGGARNAFSWVAIPITGIWDAFTLYKVAREARLRLFGHKLASYIVNDLLTDAKLHRLSAKAREGAVRAVATTMVLTQNYHPNMLILLLRLTESAAIDAQCAYDDWEEFLALLRQVTAEERCFLLDLLSVSAAFDGRLSGLERQHLPEAFQELTGIYMERTEQLCGHLQHGRLHAAKALCKLDFTAG